MLIQIKLITDTVIVIESDQTDGWYRYPTLKTYRTLSTLLIRGTPVVPC